MTGQSILSRWLCVAGISLTLLLTGCGGGGSEETTTSDTTNTSTDTSTQTSSLDQGKQLVNKSSEMLNDIGAQTAKTTYETFDKAMSEAFLDDSVSAVYEALAKASVVSGALLLDMPITDSKAQEIFDDPDVMLANFSESSGKVTVSNLTVQDPRTKANVTINLVLSFLDQTTSGNLEQNFKIDSFSIVSGSLTLQPDAAFPDKQRHISFLFDGNSTVKLSDTAQSNANPPPIPTINANSAFKMALDGVKLTNSSTGAGMAADVGFAIDLEESKSNPQSGVLGGLAFRGAHLLGIISSSNGQTFQMGMALSLPEDGLYVEVSSDSQPSTIKISQVSAWMASTVFKSAAVGFSIKDMELTHNSSTDDTTVKGQASVDFWYGSDAGDKLTFSYSEENGFAVTTGTTYFKVNIGLDLAETSGDTPPKATLTITDSSGGVFTISDFKDEEGNSVHGTVSVNGEKVGDLVELSDERPGIRFTDGTEIALISKENFQP